jgi:hypothetical protein
MSNETSHEHVEVVAVRQEEVRGHTHITGIKLKDGRQLEASDAIARIKSGESVYTMRPPEGAPAYQAHQETGLPLLVQTRPCPDCGEEVLFA